MMSKLSIAIGSFYLVFLGGLQAIADEPPQFTPARPGTTVALPTDHGAHPDYETEWWYYTGHLVPVGGDLFTSDDRYGFQLTFFRRATREGGEEPTQIYLAHAGFTDLPGKRFIADSRLAPARLGFADAALKRLAVHHLDWSAEAIGSEHHLRFSLTAVAPELQFRFIGAEPPSLLHGEGGFSRKGECATCASMYYSLPRIELRGQIVRNGTPLDVRGLAWMDHEYMTNALQSHQVGWDWLSLMTDEGVDLMAFRIRTNDGTPPFLSGTLRKGGKTTPLGKADLRFEPTGERWISPHTGGEYPIAFRVEVPNHNVATEVKSLLADQEVAPKGPNGIAYYEGAVRSPDRKAIGYLEMTGYAKPLGDAL